MIRRRDFIKLIPGSAIAWPLAARAQPAGRMQRVGVLMVGDENDPLRQSWLGAFARGLAQFGWIGGRNLSMDVRWAGNTADRMQLLAKELVGLQPDAILASGTPAIAAFQRETQTIPIVFTIVSDPVGDGFVASLARPGGNITGFGASETPVVGRWLQLLREVAPDVRRAAMIFNPATAPYAESHYWPELETAAHALKVAPVMQRVHTVDEISTAIFSLGREPGGGLVIPGDAFMSGHHALVISLATRINLPTISNDAYFVRDGGLLSYGENTADTYRQAALYIDRILRGAKPSDLPVQLPTRFELTVNLKTAKALGLTVPPDVLAIADEVIE